MLPTPGTLRCLIFKKFLLLFPRRRRPDRRLLTTLGFASGMRFGPRFPASKVDDPEYARVASLNSAKDYVVVLALCLFFFPSPFGSRDSWVRSFLPSFQLIRDIFSRDAKCARTYLRIKQAALPRTANKSSRSLFSFVRPYYTVKTYNVVVAMAGKAVIKVVHRCTDATVNQNLDLSECQLMSFPDAIYHLMRNTVLLGCDLSSNVLRKLPSKFAIKFVYITELNLANNRLSTLPDELLDVTELQRLDISRNDFPSLPKVVFKLPRLTHLNAQRNYISEVDVNRLKSAPALREVDLRNNPLDRSNLGQLLEVESPRLTVRVTPPSEEDEDLKDLLEFEDDPLPSDRNRD